MVYRKYFIITTTLYILSTFRTVRSLGQFNQELVNFKKEQKEFIPGFFNIKLFRFFKNKPLIMFRLKTHWNLKTVHRVFV